MIKKGVEFLGVIEKNSEESPWILVFGLEIASGVKQNFVEFPGVYETVLSGIFIGKVTNLKISGFFFSKKYILNLHGLIFFME